MTIEIQEVMADSASNSARVRDRRGIYKPATAQSHKSGGPRGWLGLLLAQGIHRLTGERYKQVQEEKNANHTKK